MKLTDYDVYKNIICEASGIHLNQDKSSLLESRLSPVAKRWGFESMAAMTRSLDTVPEKNLIRDIVAAMVNNDTAFFSDMSAFESFEKTVLTYLQHARKKKMRIWCTGCSSGQEAYSIAMVLRNMAQEFSGWNIEILATDISANAIEQAREAKYTQYEAQRGLPVQMLLQYFRPDDEHWVLNAGVRKMVTFKTFNLLHSMNDFGEFDVIWCANVLNDFDYDVRDKTLKNLSAQLVSDGFLVLDNDAAITKSHGFKNLLNNKSIYVPIDSEH